MATNDQLKMPAALFGKKGSRRDFLRNTAVTAIAGTALAACSIDKTEAQTTSANDADHSGLPWRQSHARSRLQPLSRWTRCTKPV